MMPNTTVLLLAKNNGTELDSDVSVPCRTWYSVYAPCCYRNNEPRSVRSLEADWARKPLRINNSEHGQTERILWSLSLATYRSYWIQRRKDDNSQKD
jgi:hypothetical protein